MSKFGSVSADNPFEIDSIYCKISEYYQQFRKMQVFEELIVLIIAIFSGPEASQGACFLIGIQKQDPDKRGRDKARMSWHIFCGGVMKNIFLSSVYVIKPYYVIKKIVFLAFKNLLR